MHTAILPYLKTYAALVGAIATALLGVFTADTTVGQVLTVVSVIATAVVTWAVPNVDISSSAYYNPEGGNRKILGKAAMSPMAPRKREDGRYDVVYLLVVVILVLVVLAIVGVL